MSPLSKIFVTIHVVLSLLLAAAVVVYVNKEDFNRNALNQTQEKLQAAQTESAQAHQAMDAAQQTATAAQAEASQRAAASAAAMNTAQKEVANLNVQLAQAASDKAAQQLDNLRLTEALKAANDSSSKLQDEVVRLRTANDTYVRQSSELNATVSDLSNKLDVTERQRKLLAEQLTEAQTQNQKISQQLNGLGMKPGTDVAGANGQQQVIRGGPPIAGVIREVQTIAGSPYATISVGSADQVTPGMEFKIVSKNGDYLGALVVDTVSPNESTGKIRGPHVDAIKPGVEATTSLGNS